MKPASGLSANRKLAGTGLGKPPCYERLSACTRPRRGKFISRAATSLPVTSRLLKKPQSRHSEGGVCPRNPLFPRNSAKGRFLAEFTLSPFATLRAVRSGKANGFGMTIGTAFQHPASESRCIRHWLTISAGLSAPPRPRCARARNNAGDIAAYSVRTRESDSGCRPCACPPNPPQAPPFSTRAA